LSGSKNNIDKDGRILRSLLDLLLLFQMVVGPAPDEKGDDE
jgi:hypothetical protein